MDRLGRKGFYPYAWVDGIDKTRLRGHPTSWGFSFKSALYDDDDDKDDENKVDKVNLKANYMV